MRTSLLLGLAISIAATAARAQAPAPTAPARTLPPTAPAADPARAADVKALSDAVTAFERAFAAGDARALAAMFTDDAQVADDSGTTRGRANIEARFASYLAANPRATISLKVDDLRFPTPDVAIEEGRAVVTPAAPGAQAETTRYTVIHVKQDGRWLQSSVRDDPAAEPRSRSGSRTSNGSSATG